MKLKAILVVCLSSLALASACGGDSDDDDDNNEAGRAGKGGSGTSGASGKSGSGGKATGGSAGTAGTAGSTSGNAGNAGSGGSTAGSAGSSGSGGSAGTAGEGGSGNMTGGAAGEGGGENGGESGAGGGAAGDGGEGGVDSGGSSGSGGSGGSSGSAGSAGTSGSAGTAGSGGSGPDPVSTAVAGDLVITEIMCDPVEVDDTLGEWFEIHNATDKAFNLNGLTLADNTGSVTIASNITLNARGYAVFARNASIGNGGVTPTYTYGDELQLSNSADTLRLSVSTTTIDQVAYDENTGFPDLPGATLSLNVTPSATQNDIAANWCPGGRSYGDGDFGTPGSANVGCLRGADDLVAGDVFVTEIMFNPGAVADASGEWFELYNPGAGAVNLNGCVISDQDLDTFTVTSDLVIDAQDYAVLSVNATTATNGGISVDYAYSSEYQLANTSDEVVVTCGGVTIDIVAYTPAFMGTSGTSTSLSPGSDHVENDSASNWCAATTVLGSGDEGTPGGGNDDCP